MSQQYFMKDTLFDVFISYSHKDKKVVDAICHFLEDKKIRCWIAPRDIPAGQEYAEAIETAINNVNAFILVCSSHSLHSQFVRKETNLAVSDNKSIIPFLIEDCSLDGTGMRLYINDRQWIDAVSCSKKAALDKLAKAVHAILDSKEKDKERSLQKSSSTVLTPGSDGGFSENSQTSLSVGNQSVEYRGKTYSRSQIVKIADLQPWLVYSSIIYSLSFLVFYWAQSYEIKSIMMCVSWGVIILHFGLIFFFLFSRNAIKSNLLLSLSACVVMIIPLFNLYIVLFHILQTRKILQAAGLKTKFACVPKKELAAFEKSI